MNKHRVIGFALIVTAGCLGSWFLLIGGTVAADTAGTNSVEAKLHAMVDQLTPEQQAALYLLLSQLTVDSGQTAAAAADPLAVAKEKLADFAKAASAGDVDAMMANISEKFEHYQFGDKEGLHDFLQNAADMGYLDDLKIKLDEAELEMDGDTAIIYPVEVEGSFGTGVFEFQAKEEDGKWMIVGLDVSGI